MATITKSAPRTDLSKEFPQFFKATATPEVVELPEASYLALEGAGVPEQALPPAFGALYPVVFTVKMKLKAQGRDFRVCPVEAQWWLVAADGSETPNIGNAGPENWRSQVMLMVPDFVSEADVEEARAAQAGKRANPLVRRVRLVRIKEGLSVQVMHIGPYEAEAPTIAAMHAFIEKEGLEPAGRHHEVYLGDPRRTKPERLRTLLRQPVRRR